MNDFIKLTTSDDPDTPFYVRASRITALYRYAATEPFTVISYDAHTGTASWNVKETPAEILDLIDQKSKKQHDKR